VIGARIDRRSMVIGEFMINPRRHEPGSSRLAGVGEPTLPLVRKYDGIGVSWLTSSRNSSIRPRGEELAGLIGQHAGLGHARYVAPCGIGTQMPGGSSDPRLVTPRERIRATANRPSPENFSSDS
jgi:hypothetical protein